jgi:hypothetical protein
MKLRNIINEQESLPGPNVIGIENIQNKLLQLAVNNKCFTNKGFPKGAFKDMKTNKEVMYKKSDNPVLVGEKRNYIFIIPQEDGLSFTVEYRDRPDEQGKVIKTLTGIRCSTITQTTDPTLTPDQEQIISFLKGQGFKAYSEVQPNSWNNYSLVDIYTDPTVVEIMKDKPYLQQQIQSNKDRVFWMWKGKGLTATSEDKTTKGQQFVDFLIKNNNWKKPDDVSPETRTNYLVVDMGDEKSYINDILLSKYKDYIKYFQKGYLLYQPIVSLSAAELNQKNETFIQSAKMDYDKKVCRNVIVSFYNKMATTSRSEENRQIVVLPGEKEVVQNCLNNNKGKYPGLSKEIEALKYTTDKQFKIDHTIDYTRKAVRESEEKMLKQTISEGLTLLKDKQKKMLSESKIVRNRLEILAEGRDLNNKRELKKFFNDYLNESAYLSSRGYDSQIISEQFLDLLKGFFTGTGVESVMSTFKESAVKWILDKIGVVDSSGWIGSIIITALGNLKFGDIGKLTDCNFLVPYLAKSVAEGAVRKFMVEKGMDSGISSVIRNAIIEVLEDSAFGQSIEKGLEKIICPSLGGLKSKMSSMTNMMKNKALGSQESSAVATTAPAATDKGVAAML